MAYPSAPGAATTAVDARMSAGIKMDRAINKAVRDTTRSMGGRGVPRANIADAPVPTCVETRKDRATSADVRESISQIPVKGESVLGANTLDARVRVYAEPRTDGVINVMALPEFVEVGNTQDARATGRRVDGKASYEAYAKFPQLNFGEVVISASVGCVNIVHA